MERDTESTVYGTELKGIFLALQINEATRELHDRKATVFTNNQSALRTMRKSSNTFGQYILRGILQLLDGLKARGINSEFRWIPAHRGIPSNEAADTAAKQAAGWTPETIWTTRGN
jgi:ribonuclease HI